jgi:hypothetical protein
MVPPRILSGSKAIDETDQLKRYRIIYPIPYRLKNRKQQWLAWNPTASRRWKSGGDSARLHKVRRRTDDTRYKASRCRAANAYLASWMSNPAENGPDF